MVTAKNHLITRDIDLLKELAKWNAVSVSISLTTLDAELSKVMEPRASRPSRRLAAIEELCAAGIPVSVLTAPIIPGLNDHEIPALLAAAAKAGALDAGYTILRLPYAVAPLFEAWLERHVPGHKDKVLGRIREMRGGKLYDAKFGKRMSGEGPLAQQIKTLYQVAKRRAGLPRNREEVARTVGGLSTSAFRVPTAQLSLFE